MNNKHGRTSDDILIVGKDILKKWCKKNNINYEFAEAQIIGVGSQGVLLGVSNPDAPKPDGLANDMDTVMLPTLIIRVESDGSIEETEYTDMYLKSSGAKNA